MNSYGWIMLISAWGSIIVLAAYTLYKTLRVPSQELTAPLELEAEIEENEALRERNEAQNPPA